MASSLNLQFKLDALVSGVLQPQSIPQMLVGLTSASERAVVALQVVGTAAESINIGDLSDDAMVILINKDDTNFIEVGQGSFTALFEIPPGEMAIMPKASVLANLQVKADTAACDMLALIYERD